jgi:hypothetical protein
VTAVSRPDGRALNSRQKSIDRQRDGFMHALNVSFLKRSPTVRHSANQKFNSLKGRPQPTTSLLQMIGSAIKEEPIDLRQRAAPKKIYASSLKKLFGAPQIGQAQSSGMSSQRVPGAMPQSGSPFASS